MLKIESIICVIFPPRIRVFSLSSSAWFLAFFFLSLYFVYVFCCKIRSTIEPPRTFSEVDSHLSCTVF